MGFVLCSGKRNSGNIYPIITYFISFESKSSALQDPMFTKSCAEHPFFSSGHRCDSPQGGVKVVRKRCQLMERCHTHGRCIQQLEGV